jgi:hypothetical protein
MLPLTPTLPSCMAPATPCAFVYGGIDPPPTFFVVCQMAKIGRLAFDKLQNCPSCQIVSYKM